MRVLKLKDFAKWARKEKVSDASLLEAVQEIENGLFEGSLGAFLIKKRVAKRGHGKRSSLRTILAYRTRERVIFMYGYAKNQRANISTVEEKALRKLARIYMEHDDKALRKALDKRIILEIA